ncbi:MAG: hypothetical protein IKV61_05265 [Clostridia bacterium]|nr:hypothetical protein [Clostridia bacterium]
MELYGKTILSCYMMLDKIVNQIENLIKTRARNSFYDYSSTLKQSDKILKMCNVRIDLLELKEIAKEALNCLNNEQITLISYKYFGILPKEKDFDLTSRNYFRKQVKALKTFSSILKNKGHNEEWFVNKYLTIPFIGGAYQRVLNEQGKKHSMCV